MFLGEREIGEYWVKGNRWNRPKLRQFSVESCLRWYMNVSRFLEESWRMDEREIGEGWSEKGNRWKRPIDMLQTAAI